MTACRIFRHGLLVGREDFRSFWTWRTWLLGWLARILTSAAIWVLLGRMTGASSQTDYLLIGNAAVAGVGTFAIAAAAWDRWEGTYPLLVVAPGSMAPALMGRMSIWIWHWVGSSLATFAFLMIAFGWRPAPVRLLPVPAGVLLLSVSTFCFSLFLGALVGLIPALRNILINLLTTAIIAFCGVCVPVGFWPGWVQAIAAILPTTHGVAAIRLMLAGGPAADVLALLGLEALVGLFWLALALLAIDRVAETGRVDGSIEFS
jgi:ABC-2 type transport system permease protein